MPELTIRHDVYLHGLPVEDHQLGDILKQLGVLTRKVDHMSAELDKLTAAVTRNTSVDASIVTLVEGLAQQIRDLITANTELPALKAALGTLADQLEASSDAEATAVQANTPTPPPAP